LPPTKPHNKSSSITSQNPPQKKIKTKHTDAQSSFLVTLSIKITIKVDHVWEKTHIKTHPENPSFSLETDPNTQNSYKLCTKIIIIIIIIIVINQQQNQTNP
jgi:hypothetical protein